MVPEFEDGNGPGYILKLTVRRNQIPWQFPTRASFLSSNLADYAQPKFF